MTPEQRIALGNTCRFAFETGLPDALRAEWAAVGNHESLSKALSDIA